MFVAVVVSHGLRPLSPAKQLSTVWDAGKGTSTFQVRLFRVAHIPRFTACPSFDLCFDGSERQQEHASLLGARTAYLLQQFWGIGIPSPDLAH
jgi:hypothetical protein